MEELQEILEELKDIRDNVWYTNGGYDANYVDGIETGLNMAIEKIEEAFDFDEM